MNPPIRLLFALAAAALLAAAPARAQFEAVDPVPRAPVLAPAPAPPADSGMVFQSVSDSTTDDRDRPVRMRARPADQGEWWRAPFGDELITHPDPWRARAARGHSVVDLGLDYNRADLLRYGASYQLQQPETMYPRLGALVEYATGRRRTQYGVQVEQPLLPTARFVLGVDLSRRTDHGDLQQSGDAENSLLLLLAHEDWRDYFEREGAGAYLSWRVPDFSTVSVHWRRDRYRSLATARHVVAWFNQDRELRANPAIDDGDAHSVLLRLERLTHHTRRSRGGLYHWIELERAGGSLGGDFDFTRALGDVRSIVRLSPAATLALRTVGGTALQGTLPLQKQFVLGGVDGLRGHPYGSFRGDNVLLGQAEYSIGIQAFDMRPHRDGLRALLFADAGTAWNRATQGELSAQRIAVDGGVGVGTTDEDFTVTFARNLQDPDSRFVVTLRLQRPF